MCGENTNVDSEVFKKKKKKVNTHRNLYFITRGIELKMRKIILLIILINLIKITGVKN